MLTACTTPLNSLPPLQTETVEYPQTVGCNFSDLTGYVHAENNINAVQGLIVLSNYTDNPCLIDSIWDFLIVDSQQSPIISTSINLVNTNIYAEQYLSIDFTWNNYCQQDSNEPFGVKILDTETQQMLYIPIEDPNGNLISSPPACKDQNQKQSFLLQISQ